MSQTHVCSYCYLIQRAEREMRLELSAEDVRRYVVHLRVRHGVTLGPDISE
jgi:hypothetical protein